MERRDLFPFVRPAGFGRTRAESNAAAVRLYSPGAVSTWPAMRRPISSSPQEGAPEAVPSAAVVALNRMAFGPRPGDLEAFNALGSSDTDRLQAYIDQQLDPGSIDDSDFEARLVQAGFTTLDKSLAQLWADHVVGDPDWSERVRPANETTRATFLRAVYSRRQLVEVLADFWHNHFNVYGWDSYSAPVWVHYDRDIIRANLLGNFRQMLEANAQSVEMLYFLDNWLNSSGGPNENYGREIFELHTLGSENYLGVMPQDEVPLDAQGRPIGFVDADIMEATRCFTGWSIAADPWWDLESGDGTFFYRGEWHDRFQKTVLGNFIPANQPDLKDGRDVLDALAAHPGTGRHIAGKLCRRLIGDSPDPEVIASAASVFTAQVAAPDQLAQVVRAILGHPSFAATWDDKVKRPFEIVAGALRASSAEFPFLMDNGDTSGFLWMYQATGQALFSWNSPNGYPDHKDDWMSTTPRAVSWRLCSWLTDASDDSEVHYIDPLAQTPVQIRSANALADFWIDRILGRPMSTAARDEIAEFMAQGFNPDLDLPLDTDEELEDRLRSMLGLIFMSPEFLRR